MSMRIGGLASGINTDEIIQKLMSAERMPLERMEQDRTLLEWQRDGYREIYQKFFEMDNNLMLDMKLSRTYQSKTVNSSNSNVVTATANPSTMDGSYNITVEQLATTAINRSTSSIVAGNAPFDPNKPMVDQLDLFANTIDSSNITGPFTFSTFNENGEAVEHTFTIGENDSLNDVLKQISDADNNVRAFYDSTAKTVIIESTRTGNFNKEGQGEIVFNETDNAFFTNVLNLSTANEKGGTDAKFTYNGLEFTSKENTYEFSGLKLELKGVSKVGESTNLSVTNNVDGAFDSIMEFVDKYNEIVEMINKTQTEERYRDYKPLTKAQKDEMDEKQIELWEEKAKSGILRGDNILTSGAFNLRQTWYSTVQTGGEITSLTQIGITTTSDFRNGGKLEVNEDKLKEALRDNPEEVYKLFSNATDDKDDPSRGIIDRLDDSINSIMKQMEERAGKTTSTLDNYTLGKRIKDLNTRITDFEDRLTRIESRYWKQFSAMEKAISQMNAQSTQLFSQFGGM
ncbi:flagellar hook-associated protein 2 [Ornithinibacillus halotolerans]|uniref:Flagellar hook-associated protein 2 n=1 Tax=Ornithinibacillus halotolerans TaxID=1274357 RepID=A0A916RSR0_9BACI|nr:flagellar hook-associated protein 2 [Ornithinibacillus halotolerans]GGA67215.1 flagellar hook-associated protein 2 [Ornithinibacillus halotolerans]